MKWATLQLVAISFWLCFLVGCLWLSLSARIEDPLPILVQFATIIAVHSVLLLLLLRRPPSA